MTEKETPASKVFNKEVIINAGPAEVWDAISRPELMTQWMSETEIQVITDWKIGNPVIIKGDWYKTGFENGGVVLEYEQERKLRYSHLSSLSRLPNKPENYCVIGFELTPVDGRTTLKLEVSNFPTEVIYKHMAFYWNVALELLKKFVERR